MRPFLCILVLILLPTLGLSTTLKVPGDFSTIQAAINAANHGDTVLVGPGTYHETIDFLGKAVTLKSSDGPNLTAIDGDRLGSVVTFDGGEGNGSILHGFLITNGENQDGGGIICQSASPEIRNNIIKWNHGIYNGGGILCEGPNCSPHILYNIILENGASFGGGVYIAASSPLIDGNTIRDNVGYLDGGGVCCAINSTPELFNNVIHSNKAAYSGGGIASSHGSVVKAINNTLYKNTAGKDGGGIFCNYAIVQVRNTCLRGSQAKSAGPEIFVGPGSSVSADYSNIQGGWPGVNNIDMDPLFKNPTFYNLHLTSASPCINMGTNDGAPEHDVDGESRPRMGTADIGADEYSGIHALGADNFTISASAKGVVKFTLNAGAANSGRVYIVLGSITGSIPGSSMPGGKVTLPINWDLFTNMTVLFYNTAMFVDFLGVLDPQGKSTAAYNTLGPLPQGTAGITMSFAYALYAPWDFGSNPIHVQIVK